MNLLPDLVEYDETEGYRLEEDPTGLLNEGFRYRDPETSTFLTRDPLGLKADPNMYTYVRQNPWTHFDPEGLDNNPPPPPPPPPPSQHNPPAKTTTTPPPTPPKLQLNMQSKDEEAAQAAKDLGLSSAPTASAKPGSPTASAKSASSGESSRSDMEKVGQVSDISGGATEIGSASNLKIMSNVKSGALSTYTSEFFGNQSTTLAANLGRASEIAGKIIKPLGYATFGADVAKNVKDVKSGQESLASAGVKTLWGGAGLVSPHVAAAQAGWAVGRLISSLPDARGGGRTIGENLSLGIQRIIAPSSVQPR